MTLSALLSRAGVLPIQRSGDAEIKGVQIDSRQIEAGGLFVAMPETTRPSESFIGSAAANGAVAAIVTSKEGYDISVGHGLATAWISGASGPFSRAIWQICDAFFDHPTRKLKLIGITGTNGKTTTAWLVRDLLNALGCRAAYLGTLGFHLPNEEKEIENTTPFAVDLYNMIAEAREAQVDVIAMEVSSHALAQERVGGLEFDVALLTNLTQDHLDFHGTMEEYAAAKHRLFLDRAPGSEKGLFAAFNVDDATGRIWALEQAEPVLTYGIETRNVNLRGIPSEVRVDTIKMVLQEGEQFEVCVPLGGSYNVQNTLSAVAAVRGLGYPLADIASALPHVRPVPGRFEPVPNQTGISVIVDYAHTPDALEKLLDSVRAVTTGKVITVFGCGGDRDKTKRFKMARSASRRSDLTVATSDNPRTEDPDQILREVLEGVEPGRASVAILDRREAVAYAVKQASPGDVVVIAGKGHENYQIIGRTKFPMDDRELARDALEAIS